MMSVFYCTPARSVLVSQPVACSSRLPLAVTNTSLQFGIEAIRDRASDTLAPVDTYPVAETSWLNSLTPRRSPSVFVRLSLASWTDSAYAVSVES